MSLAMNKKREDLEAKRKAEEEKKKEALDRIEKQNRIKSTVQSALKDRIANDNEKKKFDLDKRKADQRMAEKETKAKIQEAIDRARSRPLLVESIHEKKQASNLAKIKATKNFMEILKNTGVDPNKHMTDEQKELLAEDEYLEKRKKELGRVV